MKKKVSRKEFLVIAGKCAAGASVGIAGLSLMSDKNGRAEAAPVPWPWPYTKLDPEIIRKKAHQAYYDAGCGYGAFKGIVGTLQEVVGEPFTSIPTEMMMYGGGGGAGWGTLCGALNGAALAINLVCDRATATKLINELFGLYTITPFPSDTSNQLAQKHEFLVNKYDQPLKQTICGSPLCHTSVSTWCNEAGFKANAPERSERCARLTGDVAAKAVELLNKQFDGQFQATYTQPQSVTNCLSCHGTTMMNNVSAKMNCTQCHEENWHHK
jgi:hypothetical protein